MSKKPKLCQACGRINPSKHHSCVSCGANLDNPVIEINLEREKNGNKEKTRGKRTR